VISPSLQTAGDSGGVEQRVCLWRVRKFRFELGGSEQPSGAFLRRGWVQLQRRAVAQVRVGDAEQHQSYRPVEIRVAEGLASKCCAFHRWFGAPTSGTCVLLQGRDLVFVFWLPICEIGINEPSCFGSRVCCWRQGRWIVPYVTEGSVAVQMRYAMKHLLFRKKWMLNWNPRFL